MRARKRAGLLTLALFVPLSQRAIAECSIGLTGEETPLEMRNAYLHAEGRCIGSQDGESHIKGLPSAQTEKGIAVAGPISMSFNRIQFTFDSAVLQSTAFVTLQKIVTFLTFPGTASLGVSIEGHTDSVGSDLYNVDLSRKRAEAVFDYFVKEGRLNPLRLAIKGWGMRRPIDGKQASDPANRRVEFVLYKKSKGDEH